MTCPLTNRPACPGVQGTPGWVWGWIKIKSCTGTIALAAVYLLVENSNNNDREKYNKILQILRKDFRILDQEKITNYLYGDINAHTGTPKDDILGIEGNKR